MNETNYICVDEENNVWQCETCLELERFEGWKQGEQARGGLPDLWRWRTVFHGDFEGRRR